MRFAPVLIVMTLIAGCISVPTGVRGVAPGMADSPAPSASALTAVTLENYKRLQVGMTQSELVAILGPESETISPKSDSAQPVLVWAAPDTGPVWGKIFVLMRDGRATEFFNTLFQWPRSSGSASSIPAGLVSPPGQTSSEPLIDLPSPFEPVVFPSLPTPRPTLRPTQRPTPTPKPAKPAVSLALSGSGQTATKGFALRTGMAVFSMTHTGKSNFAVWLLGPDGDRIDLLANAIGNFKGQDGLGIEAAGEYVLDVSADGPWTIQVNQPTIGTPAAGTSFTGQGPTVLGPFTMGGGLRRFEMTHTGQSNFAIWLHDDEGDRKDLLVNEIGSFSGSKALGVTAGAFFLVVSADGDWTVKVN